MTKVLVAIADSTAPVCAPAAWADVLYLGGTGQQVVDSIASNLPRIGQKQFSPAQQRPEQTEQPSGTTDVTEADDDD